MREIRFRGKSIETGKWVYGWLVKTTGHTIFSKTYILVNGGEGELITHEVGEKSVGQYTGCKDAQNRKIYDGDILEDPNRTDTPYARKSPHKYYVVRYEAPMFIMESYNGDKVVKPMLDYTSSKVVIGNIWENRDLLK